MNIREAIGAVAQRRDLTQAQAAAVMDEIMSGSATQAQIGAFLTALHMKGETDAEIAGMASVMRQKAVPVYVDGPVTDTCGTGGDGAGTFNISTTAAFVAAGAGLTVAKHGNRAMSSVCGSADLLEGLGVQIDLDADGVARCLQTAGIGFMFAPRFHPAMRYAGPVRREIGIRTIFNVLGPLTNPAHARHQVLGVANEQLAEKLANALARLNTQHALVVHGHGGVDELTLTGPNLVFDVRSGAPPQRSWIDAAELGLQRAPAEALQGGDVAANVAITRAILTNVDQGPHRDVVLLNAAAALVAGDWAADMNDGLAQARESLASGRALRALEQLAASSRA
jgi:anthranilate phosphoribosyltransferase